MKKAISYRSYNEYKDHSGITHRDYCKVRKIDNCKLIFENISDVSNVINDLNEIINNYGFATEADLYDLIGLSSDYTMSKYGWNSLLGIKLEFIAIGIEVQFPKLKPIDILEQNRKDYNVQKAYNALTSGYPGALDEAIAYLGEYLND